jgi:branched-chain amino acid transport system permease protein
MLKGPLSMLIFPSLWFGMLCLPFTGFLTALYISGAIFCFSVLWHILKSAFRLKSSIGLRVSIPLKPSGYILFLILILLPFLASTYITDTVVLSGIYIILSLGLNIMIGYTGLLNLGYAAFYAIGAYTYAILNTKLHLGFWEALPLSMVLSGVAGFLLGIPALRLRGDYLAIVTLGFGEITRIVLNNWISLTNGPNGITGIERPSLGGFEFAGVIEYYYTVLIFVVLTIFLINRLIKSKAGRAWMSIRDDEIAATAMGINTFLYKLYAFSFGALLAGLAGQLFAAKMRFVSPESFTFFESVMIVAMVILGGQGTIAGPIIGSIILVLLPEVLREFQQYRMIFLGAGLIFMMIFRPQGIVGKKV